jgi:capsular exopolysaccharide synthesis family protein
MPDLPDNQGGEHDSPEPVRRTPPKPEQIWPPPQSGKGPVEPADAVELDWADTVDSSRPTKSAVSAPAEAARPWTGGSAAHSSTKVAARSHDDLGQLWGNIFFSSDAAAPKAIVVTSARRRDGVTQIASALSLFGATSNPELNIALVDFNLRHPAVAEVMGLPVEPGLTDVLDGRATLETAMRSVTLAGGGKLHVLTAGSLVDQPLGMIKSRQVQSLMSQLIDRFDHVIIDVASANQYPDAQVLGGMVDGVLLVVKSGDTPRETVAETKKRLDLSGVRCLGLVLNQRTDPIPAMLYRMT